MRVLAVVYCYPPLRVPASLCYLKLVLGLTELGHEVDLVAIDPASFDGIDDSLLDREVLAVCPAGVRHFRVWSPEAHPIVRGLKKFGISYEIFHRFLEPRKREWTYAARRSLRRVDLSRYDVLLSCSQPHANHVLGRWIRKNTGIPWVAYFSDPWVGNPYARKRSRRIQEWNAREEASVVTGADKVLFTCDEMRTATARRYPAGLTEKFGVLPHCYVPEWYGPPAAGHDGDAGTAPYRFLHTGHFYGPRNPRRVFAAIRRLKEGGRLPRAVRFDFFGIMPGEYRASVPEMGLENVVGVHDSVPYLESLKRMSSSDALLVIDAAVAANEESVFLPSKLIDYYGSGKTIVGITPSRGATARFLRETGHLVCPVDDEEAIAGALAAAMRGEETGRAGGRRPGGYDHLSVAARCTEFLRQAVEGTRRPLPGAPRAAVAGLLLGLLLRLFQPVPAGAELPPAPLQGFPATTARQTAAAAGWLDPDWPCRTRIRVRADQIAGAGPYAGMPLLLSLSSALIPRVFQFARPDGSDLVLTKADGVTPLPREVVSFDLEAGIGEVWFLADSLSATQRDFYVYYGNPGNGCAPCSADPVWADRYLGVYHFEEDPALGILEDSGPGHHDAFAPASTGWTSSNRVPGQIGSGWWMNGSSNWIDADNLASADSTFTVSAWFAAWNQSVDASFAFSSQSGFHLSVKRNESQRMPDFASASGFFAWNPAPLPDTLLHEMTWVMDGVADTMRFYFDGLEQNLRARYAPTPPYRVYSGLPLSGHISIAGPLFPGNPLDLLEGIVDEFRVYRGTRDPGWILTTYRNEKAPLSFFEYHDEEVGGAPVSPGQPAAKDLFRVWVAPNPFTRSATIQMDLTGDSGVSVEVFDMAGRKVRTLRQAKSVGGHLRLVWDGNDGDGRPLASGIYLLKVVAGGASVNRKVIRIR